MLHSMHFVVPARIVFIIRVYDIMVHFVTSFVLFYAGVHYAKCYIPYIRLLTLCQDIFLL